MGPFPRDNDSFLAEKLRREDPEQYHTLIRMHLSFVLDLHTDDCDSGSEKLKTRVLKWNLLPFTKKSKAQTKGVMEGAPLTQEGICQVYQLIEFLGKEQNIQQEGLFRRSGKLKRQQELKALLNQGVALDLNDGRYSVHDCASVLKNFLAELPEPLLTDAHYPAHFQIAEMCISGTEGKSDGRLLRALQLLLLLLPSENRVLLSDLLGLLNLTASHQASNRMSAESLATLFTPHLACPRKMAPEALHVNAQLMSRVIAFMIRQGASSLFSIPPQLATDICAYWARKEGTQPAKKVDGRYALSGERKREGESAEVNTVFSFVDHERTAQAHNSNPTEAALAQLYAHIRSMPESSEKRRLVKQFNKENGLGTPHQHYPRILNPRGRNLGDSIKKHLFHKGIKCTKNGINQGHFNVLQQTCGDKSNNPEKTPTPRLMMFQKSMDELSPLSKASLCFSPSSLSSGDKDEPPSQLSQRKLTFSDSPPSENSCTDHSIVNINPQDITERIETNIQEKDDIFHEEITITSNNSQGENIKENNLSPLTSDSTENMRPPQWNKFRLNQDINSYCSLQNMDDEFHSPFKQPFESEGVTWSQAPNISPLPYPAISSKQCRIQGQDRDLVTSTPANQQPRYPPRLRARSSIETSLLYHQTSCMLTPVTSDENNSMSPITRSTQKMSKAMQETMMTPRSRKPVLALSGSNISHVPSFDHCSQIQTEDKVETCSIVDRKQESASETKDITKKETVGSCSELASIEIKDDVKTASVLENQSILNPDDVRTNDSISLTSTFINYLHSRSVLTASPIDLSFKEESGSSSPIVGDLESLKSEEHLSDSLLYCLDGNVPSSSPSGSSNDLEADKFTRDCSDGEDVIPRCHLRPWKRKSSEIPNEGLTSASGSPLIKIMPHRLCSSLESDECASLDTPKNKRVFETSL